MFHLTRITLPAAVSLLLPVGRPRIPSLPTPGTVPRKITGFDACFTINPITRTIYAELPPLPRPLLIYAGEDFAPAAGDTPDQHAERVLEILGPDPAAVLQALIDGSQLHQPPARVPREVAGWRVKDVLAKRGLFSVVDAAVESFPGQDGDTLRRAWHGGAALARTSPAVLHLGTGLGLSADDLDAIFRESAAIIV